MSNTKHFSKTDTETWPLPAVISGQSGFGDGFCVGVCVGFGVGFCVSVGFGVIVVWVAGLGIALFSDPVKIWVFSRTLCIHLIYVHIRQFYKVIVSHFNLLQNNILGL